MEIWKDPKKKKHPPEPLSYPFSTNKNRVLVQSQSQSWFGVGSTDELTKNRFAFPPAREPQQSQILRHCIRLMLPSNASAVAPNTNTPGLFEMHRLLADRSPHDIKALRKRSKSTRSRMISKHSRSSDRSAPLRCVSNKPSTITDVALYGCSWVCKNTSESNAFVQLAVTYIDGYYNQAAISSTSCYLKMAVTSFYSSCWSR